MGGLSTGAVQLRAECGSGFFADLVAHKEVRKTYLNTAAAADLRSRVADEVSFGGISFRRYRGSAAFGVPADKAYFYPEGVEGLFEIYYAPVDTFETVNTLGLPLYARAIPDRERDEWVRWRSRATRCRSARGRRCSGARGGPDERLRHRSRRALRRSEPGAGGGLCAGERGPVPRPRHRAPGR